MKVKVTQLCLTLCNLMDCSLPGSSVHGIPQKRNTGVGSHSLLQGNLPNPGIKPRSPTLQVDSLPAESPGKPKNTGVGSLSLLQQIFLAQELNQGLLHCRWFLYQLSYQGSTRNYLVSTSNIICLLGPFCPLKEGSLVTNSPFFAGYFLFPPHFCL